MATGDVVDHTSIPCLSLGQVHAGRIVETSNMAESDSRQIKAGCLSFEYRGVGDFGHGFFVHSIELLVEIGLDHARSRNGKEPFSRHKVHPRCWNM